MIYLAMECSGDYEDYQEVPIAASHDEERIRLFIIDKEADNARVRALYEKYSTFRTNWHRDNPRYDKPADLRRKENQLEDKKIYEENMAVYRAWANRFSKDIQNYFDEQGISQADREKIQCNSSDYSYHIEEIEEI